MKAYRRHDISDKVWALLEPHRSGRAGSWGEVSRDNRLFIQCGILDYVYGHSLERSAAGLGLLEQDPSPFYSLA
jgi:hypothetical protein